VIGASKSLHIAEKMTRVSEIPYFGQYVTVTALFFGRTNAISNPSSKNQNSSDQGAKVARVMSMTLAMP
jgi:hypothetical protein